MDRAREKHVQEIARVKAALQKTQSEYLKRDYTKYLHQLETDLKDYDRYKMQGEL